MTPEQKQVPGLVLTQDRAPAIWSPMVSMQVRRILDVVPSPGGRLVAYTQARAVMEPERNEWAAQIFLARADGSRRLMLTQEEAGTGAVSFSPDGEFVYFVSVRAGKRNIYRIRVDGGEAERLTDWKGELTGYRPSPDGKWIVFAGSHPDEPAGNAPNERHRWVEVVGASPKLNSLWIFPTEPDAEGRRPIRKLISLLCYVTNFDWSPDSRFVAFDHQPTASEDDWRRNDLSEIDVSTGRVRLLAGTRAAEGEPRYSPDGRWLAYLRTEDPARWPGEEQIVLLPRQRGSPRLVPSSFDEGLSVARLLQPRSSKGLIPRKAAGEFLGWSSDSSRLLFTGEKYACHLLYAISLDGSTHVVYGPQGTAIRMASLNAIGTHVGFSRETPEKPAEAYVMNLEGDSPVQVSIANAGLPNLPVGETTPIHWQSRDGLEVEGLLTLPPAYEPGKKYPLVLAIHGGPMNSWTHGFAGEPGYCPVASLAGRGYVILRPNIRGSAGYGREFRFANLNDWGGRDYEDLMTGVDYVISMGVADPERMAVMGWSYGGYMTNWVFTHTRRFRAAVDGAGLTDLVSFTGTTDIPSFLPDYFSGEVWERLTLYQERSPISHVQDATTPTLILHGGADIRVPPSQSYELYNALKSKGVETQMVLYPDEPHVPDSPRALMDIMQRQVEWVERHLSFCWS